MAIDTTRDIVLRLEGTTNLIMDKVTRLEKSINGNGTPGILSNVSALTDCMQLVDVRHKAEDAKTQEVKTRRWDLQKGVVLLAFAQIFTFVGLAVALWTNLK
jgi:hypothetical protein